MSRGNPKIELDINTSASEGPSLGELERVWIEIAKTEMRIQLMDSLNSMQVGFNDVEMFNLGLEYNLKTKTFQDKNKQRDTTVIEAAMRVKRKDEIRYRS